MRIHHPSIGICTVFLLMIPVVFAQSTATLSGVVNDESGAVLPGAEITVTNVDTGVARASVSDDAGRYRVSNLNVGRYELTAGLPGFQSEVRSGITLTMGREAIVDFTLKVGEISERVQVTGEAPLVETTSGGLSGLVDRQTIMELPLNGRDLTGLISLEAGTASVTTGSTGGSSGFSKQVSINGARPSSAGFLIDGSEVKSVDGGLPAGVSGNFLGAEGIQEFKVEKNAYSAQYGGSAGGVVNVLSKSGTNELHGSVYEYLRNDNLDAANFRTAPINDATGKFIGKAKPEFKRNQFGASIGGPIIRNRAFFFGNYEGLRENLGTTDFLRTLTAAAREGRLQNPNTGAFEQVAVNPAVVGYLALWPLPGPGAVDLRDGTAREPIARPRPTTEDFYQIRGDYHSASDADAFFTRLTRQKSEVISQGVLRWGARDWVYNTFVTVEERKIVTASLLNTLRFSFNRRGLGTEATEKPLVDTKLNFVPPDKWRHSFQQITGPIQATPLSSLGALRSFFDRVTNYFETSDDLAYNRGAHALKFGFNHRRMQLNGESTSSDTGETTFGSVRDLLLGIPTNWRGELDPRNDSIRGFRWNLFGWYVQDDWQAHPRLTLNLGFRHEFYTVPTEVNGKIATLRSPFTARSYLDMVKGDPWFLNPSLKSFMPRIGLAWDPTGSGKTAIRAGGGIFYNHITPDLLRQASWRSAPFTIQTNLAGRGTIPWPNIYDHVVVQGQGQPDISVFPYDYQQNPHMIQWNLNVQREILPQTALTVGYAGSRGLNLFAYTAYNVAIAERVNGRYVFPMGVRTPNPNLDTPLRGMEASADSWYNSFQASLQRRFQAGWQVQVSYTHSRTIDVTSQSGPTFGNEGGGINYYHDPKMRKSLAAFHVADSFSSSWVWLLPFGAGQKFGGNWTGFVDKVLGGWQMSGIFRAASGPAVTIGATVPSDLAPLRFANQAPDLAPGGNTNPVIGNPDVYFDNSPANFIFAPPRTIGNLGRNTLIAPGIASVDLSLTKNTQITETARVQFKFDMFNMLNRANLGTPSTNVFNANGVRQAAAGFIGSTSTTARQIQLGLRVEF